MKIDNEKKKKKKNQLIMFLSFLFVQDDDNQPTDKPHLSTACSLEFYGDCLQNEI